MVRARSLVSIGIRGLIGGGQDLSFSISLLGILCLIIEPFSPSDVQCVISQ
jgi:hypothetical protein